MLNTQPACVSLVSQTAIDVTVTEYMNSLPQCRNDLLRQVLPAGCRIEQSLGSPIHRGIRRIKDNGSNLLRNFNTTRLAGEHEWNILLLHYF
ncbi:hypothetical protein D3C86_1891170 [compost metagenome]